MKKLNFLLISIIMMSMFIVVLSEDVGAGCCPDSWYYGTCEAPASCCNNPPDSNCPCTGGGPSVPCRRCSKQCSDVPPTPPCTKYCDRTNGVTSCGNFCTWTDCSKTCSGCSGCKRDFEAGSLVNLGLTKPCITEQDSSRDFTVSGRSKFCGDIKITVEYGNGVPDQVFERTDKTLEDYSFSKTFSIPSEVDLSTDPLIKVYIEGNRNDISIPEDTTYDCSETLTLDLKYKNFYYCPEKGSTAYSDTYDMYTLDSQYVFSGISYDNWEDCVSLPEKNYCLDNPLNCVEKSGATNTYQIDPGMTGYGVTWITRNTASNGAYDLDGVNDYIQLDNKDPYDFGRADKFSISVNYKGSDTKGSIISKINAANNFKGYELYIDNNKLVGLISHELTSSVKNYIKKTSSVNVNDDTWHILVMTYDGSSALSGLKLYVDGVEVSGSPDGDGLSAEIKNTAPVRIGKRTGDNTQNSYLWGAVDNVIIYDDALTPKFVCEKAGKTLTGGVCQ